MTDSAQEATPRVLVVDDHDLFGQTLVYALRSRGLAADRTRETVPASVIETAEELRASVVLLDLHLGPDGPSGIGLIAPLRALGARVVMVTGDETPARVGECLEAGALSVVNKSEALERLVRSVREAAEGRSVVPPDRQHAAMAALRAERAEQEQREAVFKRLTPTEREVLGALMEGEPAEAIARERVVAVRTVRSQIESILAKLGVRSQLGAVALARRRGWQPG